jgi:hypothetical protein
MVHKNPMTIARYLDTNEAELGTLPDTAHGSSTGRKLVIVCVRSRCANLWSVGLVAVTFRVSDNSKTSRVAWACLEKVDTKSGGFDV